jgi:phage terminase large subunit
MISIVNSTDKSKALSMNVGLVKVDERNRPLSYTILTSFSNKHYKSTLPEKIKSFSDNLINFNIDINFHIKTIEDLKNKNEKQWKVYGLGEFAGNERQIFQFDIIEEIPIDADFVGYGMDFGFSSDPSTLVGCWKWGESIYFKELLYEKGLTTGDIINRFKALSLNREEIWCDSSEPRLIEELYRSGYNTKAVVKGKDSILFGINCMLNYKIHLHKGSQNLINEMY